MLHDPPDCYGIVHHFTWNLLENMTDIYLILPGSLMDCLLITAIIIDREAREIMYLVASVRPSVCLSVCPSSPV